MIKVYLIRHRATKQLMPQTKHNKGYSHWNPSTGQNILKQETDSPRIFTSLSGAKRAIIGWASNPNARMSQSYSNYGEWIEGEMITKDDGRNRSDLELVTGEIILKE